MNAADKDVFIAVVVIVADSDADVVASSSEPALLGNVGKRAVAVVSKEAIRVFGGCLVQRDDVRAVGEKNIQISVVVVVKDGHAAGHGFRRMLLKAFGAIERKRN